nr:reticulocalbin-2-like protein [Crepidula fornicata]
MVQCCRVFVSLTLLMTVWGSREQAHHGPSAPHHTADGEHNPDYDHQSILGSEALDDDFEGLSPEEAKFRLQNLVEKHDRDNDNFITKKEMHDWIVESFQSLDREEAAERFEEEDEDKDGKVTWDEYLDKVYGFNKLDVDEMQKSVNEAKDKNTDEFKENVNNLELVDEDRKVFDAADANKDGSLNSKEYFAFFMPNSFPQLELERFMRQSDKNKDGTISMEEFMPEGATGDTRTSSEESFKNYDKDKDGSLSLEEAMEWINPSSDEHADVEVEHLFTIGDVNHDGKLSKDEILNKADQFVGSAATDYGNLIKHEEL